MPIFNLPNTNIPIHCFKCDRKLACDEVDPNPFPSPVNNREEWFAYAYICAGCGTEGIFQYRVRGAKEEGEE